ncbi:hypothetical protein B7494_g1358 [Chlorociboria aeruginascens]|nr:hypothetical protein B7494_g1358 [Chlorociboria aeruginascens]
MAVNVYLVFFRRYDAYRLKRLSWIYGVLCYGVPFIPAIVCLLVKTSKKGKVYGNATLWCWIDNDWAPLRIYSYYGPIWVAILITFIIYTRVGIEIFQKRSELRGAMSRVEGNGSLTSGTGKPEPIVGIRTTEIEVTHDTRDKEGNSPTRDNSKHSQKDQYSVTISAREQPPQTPRTGILTKRPTSMDKIKWAYTRCAVLFAISILITWVPASVNRVYGLRYPSKPSFALNIGSAVVLPLQGFWNTIIYFTTSLQICARVMSRLRSRENFRVIEIVHLGGSRHGDGESGERNESQIEFSTSRSVISVDSLPSL